MASVSGSSVTLERSLRCQTPPERSPRRFSSKLSLRLSNSFQEEEAEYDSNLALLFGVRVVEQTCIQITVCTVSVLSLQGSPGVVTCMDNQPHGLQTGQSVLFKEVNGMVELNGTSRQVSGRQNPTSIIYLYILYFHYLYMPTVIFFPL